MRKPWKQIDAFAGPDLFEPMNWQQDGAQMSMWGSIKSHVQTCLGLVGGFVRENTKATPAPATLQQAPRLPTWKRLALKLLGLDWLFNGSR